MSLINDMLRDLDSRNAAGSERNGLDRNVRALPGASGHSGIHPLLLVSGAALLGGAAVWFALKLQTPEAAPPAPQAASPAVATPAVMPPAATAPAAEPATPETPLRLDTDISAPSASRREPAAVTPTLGAPPTPPTPPAPAASVAVVPSPGASAPAPQLVVPPKTHPQASTPKPAQTTGAPPTVTANTAIPAESARNTAGAHISKQPSGASLVSDAAEAEYRRGATAIRRGDQVDAGEAFRSALRISPTHIAARQALLALLTDQQRWADAETLALDGVGLYPQRSDWALLAARLMYERGEASSALTLLDRQASTARQNPDYQVLHALLLQRAGRNAEAADCYQRALTVRPLEGRWWYGLGRALDADHRDAQARQAYEKARETGNLPSDLQQAVERRLR